MAKLERTFHMDYPPEQAQVLFLRDVGPAFAQDGEFLLQHEKPGELRFSEGDVAASPTRPDEPPLFSERDIERVVEEGAEDSIEHGGGGIPMRALGGPTGLSRGFARHIKVEFTADGEGTHVVITGHAEHDLRDAIDRLGTPGHWPETANDPHS